MFPILPGTTLSADWLKSLIDDALQADDVFCPAFLSGVVFCGYNTYNDYSLTAGACKVLSSHGTLWTEFIDAANTHGYLFPGPYVLEKGLLWKVSRLYEDTANAFTMGLRTISNGRYCEQCPKPLLIGL